MEEKSFDEVVEKEGTSVLVRISLVALLLLAVAAAAYFLDLGGIRHQIEHAFNFGHEHETEDVTYDYGLDETFSQEINTEPQGQLLLALNHANIEFAERIFIFEQDLSKTGLEINPVFIDNEVDSIVSFISTNSDEMGEGSGFLVTYRVDDGSDSDASKVYFTKNIFEKLSNENIRIKQPNSGNESNFTWSNNTSKLAYQFNNFPNTYKDFRDPKNWSIVIYDYKTDNIEKIIQQSFSPNFSEDGQFLLYLKENGLYRYSIELDQENPVITLEDDSSDNGFSTADNFKVSDTGTHAVWTSPYNGMITVYEITSWNPINFRELGRIQNKGTEYMWPVFSPDGEFYAVYAFERDSATSLVSGQRIEIRRIDNRKIVRSYSLVDFDPGTSYPVEWVIK